MSFNLPYIFQHFSFPWYTKLVIQVNLSHTVKVKIAVAVLDAMGRGRIPLGGGSKLIQEFIERRRVGCVVSETTVDLNFGRLHNCVTMCTSRQVTSLIELHKPNVSVSHAISLKQVNC